MNRLDVIALLVAAGLALYSAICLSLIAWRLRRQERAERLKAIADPVRGGAAAAMERRRGRARAVPTGNPST